jgi:hypothetical protein
VRNVFEFTFPGAAIQYAVELFVKLSTYVDRAAFPGRRLKILKSDHCLRPSVHKGA